MTEIKYVHGEPRLHYLLRVLEAYFDEHPVAEYTLIWDEAECDGQCLVDDLRGEIEGVLAELNDADTGG
jgi:hypothetical protein